MDLVQASDLDLIGAIYDAVIDQSLWDDTVDRIRQALGFHLCMLGANAFPSGAIVIQASSNVPKPYVDTIYRYGEDMIAIWGGPQVLLGMPLEEPIVQTEHSGPAQWRGHPFYDEWCVPQGLVDQAVVVLENNPRMLAHIGFGVHESMPPVSDLQRHRLRVVAPHLRRAVIITGLLQDHTEVAATFEAALGALNRPVILVSERLDIVYANEQAAALLSAGSDVASRGGRLDLTGEIVDGQLRSAVSAAAQDSSRLTHGNGIPLRSASGAGMIVHVLPLKRRAGRPSRAVAALFFADPALPLNIPLEALRLMYQLRPAEVRVLELTLRGLTGPEVAKALSIAPSTVKTYIEGLFTKFNVSSRVDLVRVAAATMPVVSS